MMHISKVLKDKRDAEQRLRQSDPGKMVVYYPGTEAGDPPSYDPPGGAEKFTEQVHAETDRTGIPGCGGGVNGDWPPFMEQDGDGLKVYDSPEKDNLKATVGRSGEVHDVLVEEGEDFEAGELDGVVAGDEGLELYRAYTETPAWKTNTFVNGKPSTGTRGYKFKVLVNNIYVSKLRAFSTTNSSTVYLWRMDDGLLLATKTFTSIPDQWSEVELDSPIPLEINHEYMVGINVVESDRYYRNNSAGQIEFDSAIQYMGHYSGSTDTLPTLSTNYATGVDVMLLISSDYLEQGSRFSPPLNLSPLTTNPGLLLSWQADEPEETSITIETAVTDSEETPPDEQDWEEQTNGELISNVPEDLTNCCLWVRQTLETEDTSATPILKQVQVYYGTEIYGIIADIVVDVPVKKVAGKTGEVVLYPADVGLGNVKNYDIASQEEAEAGEVSNKYMTPERTKQAIDALAPSGENGGNGNGGATKFTDLTDVPGSYGGQQGKFPRVNSTEDGLEFADMPSGGGEGGSGTFDYGLITSPADIFHDYGGVGL